MTRLSQPRQRSWATKRRSGCRTCRKRHLKCDEGTPACARCTNSNRPCGGYSHNFIAFLPATSSQVLKQLPLEARNHYASPLLPSLPCSLISLTSCLGRVDRDAFEFYLVVTASQLGRAFETPLWQKAVTQLCPHVPAVLYAVISLGAIHRAHVASPSSSSAAFGFDDDLQQLALSRHGRALAHLQSFIQSQHLTDPEPRIEIVLLACLLFISFNLLQGELESATSHFRTGLKLIRSIPYKTSLQCARILDRHVSESQPSLSTLNDLTGLFGCFDGGFAYFRVRPVPLASIDYPVPRAPSVLSSLDSARRYLDDLVNDAFRLRDRLVQLARKEVKSLANHPDCRDWATQTLLEECHARRCLLAEPSFDRDRSALVQKFAEWTKLFSQLPERSLPDLLSIRLRIRRFFAEFVITTCRHTKQTLCDGYNAEFSSILDMASEYLSRSSTQPDDPEIGPEILTTVCLVGIKCRDPTLRRKAIRILEQFRPNRDLYDTTMLAAFIAKIAEVEESGCCDPQTSNDIPEHARVSDVLLTGDIRDPAAARLVFGRILEDGHIDIGERVFRPRHGTNTC